MDWDDIRCFLAVWRTGSFAGAAETLRVDRTTVGRRIDALEASLGTCLFERAGRQLHATSAAERMVGAAEAAERAMFDLRARVQGEDARVEGVVRVSTSEATASGLLLPELGALHREHPGITLELLASSARADLLKREADVAVRFGLRPEEDELLVRRLGSLAWVAYASPAYLSPRGPIDLDRLEGQDVIALGEGLTDTLAGRWLAARTHGARITLRSSSLHTLRAACATGWGIAVLPSFLADGTDLVRLSSTPVCVVDVWLVVHPDLARSARVRVTVDAIAAALGRRIQAG